jgi:hypothetical protein
VIFVAFYYGAAWYSHVISWFTGDGPSHAALVYRDPIFGLVQLGSEAGGWMLMPATEPRRVYRLPGVDLRVGMLAERHMLGCGYDFGGLLGMSVVMVAWRWLKMKVRNPTGSRLAWFCSEAVACICRASGMTLDLVPGDTDPARLEAELRARGAVAVAWAEAVQTP